MRGILEFLKTTLAGGFFVVLPVVLIWLIFVFLQEFFQLNRFFLRLLLDGLKIEQVPEKTIHLASTLQDGFGGADHSGKMVDIPLPQQLILKTHQPFLQYLVPPQPEFPHRRANTRKKGAFSRAQQTILWSPRR